MKREDCEGFRKRKEYGRVKNEEMVEKSSA